MWADAEDPQSLVNRFVSAGSSRSASWGPLSSAACCSACSHGLSLGSERFFNFTQAHLNGADLTNALIDEGNFVRADLVDVKFIDAEINNANFIRANLTIANFTKAEVGLANFTRADLTDAVLVYIDLSDSTLDRAIIHWTKYSAETRWPGGTPPEGAVLMDAPTE
ncbi:pentapeptide repeat-containing protein [Rhodococcus sp. NPDC019639]|uniref:pentapeptide repeat-containing protein n=1 Tax=Rhodococcus sp. NPDC019639 TaxID=3364506 RepID=UPI003799C4E2